MKVLKNFSFWVSIYVTAVGLLFSILPFTQFSLIEFKSPNRYFLVGIALVLFISGCIYSCLSLNRKLESKGPSVTKIRKQALDKIESKTYLAKAAQEDPDLEVRRKALKRLKEITT
jgi:hypothetical protein